MNELMEQPLLIIALGMITVVILIGGLLKTGQSSLLYALIAAIAAFGGLITAERLVVTDGEQIQSTIRQVAHLIEHEEFDAVLDMIHSEAGTIRIRAQNEIPRFEFSVARVTKFRELSVKSETTATAEFTVRLEGRMAGSSDENIPVIRIVVVDLKKEGGLWKVSGYEHFAFSAGKKQRDLFSNFQ